MARHDARLFGSCADADADEAAVPSISTLTAAAMKILRAFERMGVVPSIVGATRRGRRPRSSQALSAVAAPVSGRSATLTPPQRHLRPGSGTGALEEVFDVFANRA